MALLAVVVLPGCGGGSRDRDGGGVGRASGAARPPRILLIGLDGADLAKVEPLAAAGRLPNLARLMQQGVVGRLETVANASPIVWTSVATGVMPEKHGIEFFRLEGEPAASTMRKRPALWNILGYYGHTAGILAWWATFPAERVRGYIVSPYVLLMPPHGTETRVRRFWDPGDPRKTYPPELQDELADLIYLEDDLDLASRPELYADPERTTNTGWALAKDESYYEMALRLLRTRPVDLFAVYFQAIDAASHDFDRWVHGANVNEVRAPRVSATEVEAAMGRVDAMYEHIDAMIGGLVAQAGPSTDILVVSDHGWSYDGTSHWNDDPGIFVATGPSLAAHGSFAGISVLDIVPMALTILDVPLSRDLDGSVPEGLLDPALVARREWVDAYPFPAVSVPEGTVSAAPEDAMMIERLEALGYLSVE